MSQPFVGEIRLFAGNFAPQGWLFCDGSLLPISEYETLFNLIGTTYGGDGEETFALPDYRSRIPIHQGTLAGNTYIIGQTGGVEQVALTTNELPNHTHAAQAAATGATSTSPIGNVPAAWSDTQYTQVAATTPMADTLTPVGGNQPHENRVPMLAVSYIISMFGIFPSPN